MATLENGVKPEYSLAPLGQEQAREAGRSLARALGIEDGEPRGAEGPVVLYCSPFSRTVETATLAGAAVGLAPGGPGFTEAPALRERFFGSRLELQPHEHYAEAWAIDQADPTAPVPGDVPGESAAAVSGRLREFLLETDARHEGTTVLLVAHGDVLQILQATVRGTPLGEHRRDYAIETGQLVRVL